MPPKRIVHVERDPYVRPRPSKGYARATYDALTAPENATVVRSIAVFGVSAPLIPLRPIFRPLPLSEPLLTPS